MRKSEIFDLIMEEVSSVCEVKKCSVINGSKLQAVVDARMLSVQYMMRQGLSADDIALIAIREQANDMSLCPPIDKVKAKARGINKQFNEYSRRCLQSRAFCLMSLDIAKFCREKFESMELTEN